MEFEPQDFILGNRFRNLVTSEIEQAIAFIATMFPGVSSLWGAEYCALTDEERTNKRYACYNLLVAWYIVQNFPAKAIGGAGGASMGALPVDFKSMKDVSVRF